MLFFCKFSKKIHKQIFKKYLQANFQKTFTSNFSITKKSAWADNHVLYFYLEIIRQFESAGYSWQSVLYIR